MRTAAQGFGAGDTNRRKYGLLERDDVTGLDHTWFRKYESFAGRWTSPDPYRGSMSIGNPQTLNRYSYVLNDPVNFIDPTGLDCWYITIPGPPAQTLRICSNEAVQIYAKDGLDDPFFTGQFNPRSFLPKPELPQDPRTGLASPSLRPLDQAPTLANVRRDMNLWRARKLPQCLKEAARDYEERKAHLRMRYNEDLMPGTTIEGGLSVANLLLGTLGTNLGGVLLKVAFVDAYHIPKAIAASRAYTRAQATCHSLYDQR